ncbi:MAG: hypothetical protein R6V35_03675 [Candidatus Nanohaloarchaea archaeon]
MSTGDVIDWLLENGPASTQDIVEGSDMSKGQVRRNLRKMTKWEDYYEFTIDKSKNYNVYDVEKREKSKSKRFF